MEMPEGWKRCKIELMAAELYLTEYEMALDLMKEMAEAGEDMYIIGGPEQSERFKEVWRKFMNWNWQE